MQLNVEGKYKAMEKADKNLTSLELRQKYSVHGSAGFLAAAVCRWWTCGEDSTLKNGRPNPFVAPYFLINKALREKKDTPDLERCLDAVVLLM